MAKATATYVQPVYMLELSNQEAAFIVDVMRKIGGDLKKSRRRHADEVLAALRSAGVCQTDAYDSEGSIRFDNGDNV